MVGQARFAHEAASGAGGREMKLSDLVRKHPWARHTDRADEQDVATDAVVERNRRARAETVRLIREAYQSMQTQIIKEA